MGSEQKFGQSKSGRYPPWGLANSVQSLQPDSSSNSSVLLGYTTTGFVRQAFCGYTVLHQVFPLMLKLSKLLLQITTNDDRMPQYILKVASSPFAVLFQKQAHSAELPVVCSHTWKSVLITFSLQTPAPTMELSKQ